MEEAKRTKLDSYVTKHHKHKCNCPVVKTASGYYKKHGCMDYATTSKK